MQYLRFNAWTNPNGSKTGCMQQLNNFVSRIFETFCENKEIWLFFGRYDLPSSLKGDTRRKMRKGKNLGYNQITALIHIAKVPIDEDTSFAHQDKDSAGRLSSTKDHRPQLTKFKTSSCSRRSEHMGTREYFPTSKATERATKREQTRRLFNIPPLMSQLELRYSLDTEVFILVPRHYSSIRKSNLSCHRFRQEPSNHSLSFQ